MKKRFSRKNKLINEIKNAFDALYKIKQTNCELSILFDETKNIERYFFKKLREKISMKLIIALNDKLNKKIIREIICENETVEEFLKTTIRLIKK